MRIGKGWPTEMDLDTDQKLKDAVEVLFNEVLPHNGGRSARTFWVVSKDKEHLPAVRRQLWHDVKVYRDREIATKMSWRMPPKSDNGPEKEEHSCLMRLSFW